MDGLLYNLEASTDEENQVRCATGYTGATAGGGEQIPPCLHSSQTGGRYSVCTHQFEHHSIVVVAAEDGIAH